MVPMDALYLISELSLAMMLMFLAGVPLFLVSLAMASRGRKKPLYYCSWLIVVPFVFLIASKFLAPGLIESTLEEGGSDVGVISNAEIDARSILSDVMKNRFSLKGRSGSHPKDSRYYFNICMNNDCVVVSVAGDSRESDLYWVAIEVSGELYIPIGYSRLDLKI